MSVQTTLLLNKIETSKLNPRKRFNEEAIEGLAQSILTDGLLQPIVVHKPKGKKKKHIGIKKRAAVSVSNSSASLLW